MTAQSHGMPLLRYAVDGDAILMCVCGWMDNLGFNPEPKDVLDAVTAHLMAVYPPDE